MTALSQSTKRKLSLLQLADELGNVAKASRRMATICSSVKRLFFMDSSLGSGAIVSSYEWTEERGQVTAIDLNQGAPAGKSISSARV